MENDPNISDPISHYMKTCFGETICDGTMTFDKIHLVSLQSYEMVDVHILDIVSYILKDESAKRGFAGLVPPSLLSKMTIRKQPLPPACNENMRVKGLNLHHIADHYVVSVKKETEMFVYDSLPSGIQSSASKKKELFEQLTTIYGSFDQNLVKFICPQEQGNLRNNCGKVIHLII